MKKFSGSTKIKKCGFTKYKPKQKKKKLDSLNYNCSYILSKEIFGTMRDQHQ